MRPYGVSVPGFGWAIGSGDTGTIGRTESSGVAVDKNGNLYWAGTFDGRLEFSPTDQHQAGGDSDLF